MGERLASGRLVEGTVFGHYEIVRHLGSGGMGSVYEASHAKLGKRVAVKTLLPHYADHPEAQARFLREGKLAAKLSHPHVVAVTDFGIEDGVPYLVMEFLEGEDLGAVLERGGRLSTQQVADLMIPVVSALAAAHDQQIVHRDLKPQNIFLARTGSSDPVPKVLDFGISKMITEGDAAQLTGSMNLLGTPAYMSPEQARSSKQVDARSDQYTLALIVYQCVTGKMPFVSEGIYELLRLVVEGNFVPPSQVIEGLSPEFEGVVLRGMANLPADRYPTTWEFGAALLPFASMRQRVLWEAEFSARSSTYVGPDSDHRSSSSQALRAITPFGPQGSISPPPAAGDAEGAFLPATALSGGSDASRRRQPPGGSGPDRQPSPSSPQPDARSDRAQPSVESETLGEQATRIDSSGSTPNRLGDPRPDRGSLNAPDLAPSDGGRAEEPVSRSKRWAYVGGGFLVALAATGGGVWWAKDDGAAVPLPPEVVTSIRHPEVSAPAPKVEPPVVTGPPTAIAPPSPPREAAGSAPTRPDPEEAPPPAVTALGEPTTLPKPPPARRARLGVLVAGDITRNVTTRAERSWKVGRFGGFDVFLDYGFVDGKLTASLYPEPRAKIRVDSHGQVKASRESPYSLGSVTAQPVRVELQHGEDPPVVFTIRYRAGS